MEVKKNVKIKNLLKQKNRKRTKRKTNDWKIIWNFRN